jgi:hypothetical protein
MSQYQSVMSGPSTAANRALSPDDNYYKTREQFDFPAFVKFLIKLGIKILPQIESKSQAVLVTVEKYIVTLLNHSKTDSSVKNSRLNKMI